jgi:flavorubredoxin
MTYEIVDGIYWVGIHMGKEVPLSLNAFILKDKNTALIDTGAVPTKEIILKNIKEIVDPATIKYIILTHGCVDHCGGLGSFLEVAPNAEVVGSEMGVQSVGLYGVQPKTTRTMKDGETLDLGEKRLRFISAPYIDKPDSMFIYEETNKVLFTADAFGTWTPEWKLFADGDVSEDLKMYNNVILGGPQRLANILKRIKEMDIKIIAPGHGPMLRSNIQKYIGVLSEE